MPKKKYAPPHFVLNPAHSPAAPPGLLQEFLFSLLKALALRLNNFEEDRRLNAMAAATSAFRSLLAGPSFLDPHAQLHADHARGSGELPAKGPSPFPQEALSLARGSWVPWQLLKYWLTKTTFEG